MERSGCGKVTAAAYDSRTSNEQYIPGPTNWIRQTARSFAETFSNDENHKDMLPQHNISNETCATTNVDPPLVRDHLLLTSLQRSQGRGLLSQESIVAIESDRRLFSFFREQVARASDVHWGPFFLKTVTGVQFAKVSQLVTRMPSLNQGY